MTGDYGNVAAAQSSLNVIVKLVEMRLLEKDDTEEILEIFWHIAGQAKLALEHLERVKE